MQGGISSSVLKLRFYNNLAKLLFMVQLKIEFKMAQPRIVVVGAGVCGLTIARLLQDAKIEVILLEKSNSAGGRMATRRVEDYVFDHGAQFYKSSIEKPFFWHHRWTEEKISQVWFSEDRFSFYCSAHGMNSLAKNLAQNLNIRFNQKLITIGNSSTNQRLVLEDGDELSADLVILTCPLPQSLEILSNSQVNFSEELKKIEYAKALVGLVQVQSHAVDIKYQLSKSAIFSISNNFSKAMGKGLGLTVVMNQDFSEKYFASSDSEVLDLIHFELGKTFNIQSLPLKSQLKKWRFSHPIQKHPENFVVLPSVILAGDAFGGGSLAGAVNSATSVARHILEG